MFKGNVKIPDQPKPRQADPYDIYQSSEIKDKDLDLVVDERMERSIEGNTQTNKRKSYDKAPSYKNAASLRKAKNIDSKIEIKAKEFERVLESTRKRKAAISEFNRKLKNPVNIKEYIIISEILGKPKAMRR